MAGLSGLALSLGVALLGLIYIGVIISVFSGASEWWAGVAVLPMALAGIFFIAMAKAIFCDAARHFRRRPRNIEER